MTTREHDEAGLTLVELIIYMVIAVVVVSLISAIFINGWRAQSQASQRDGNTGTTNAVTASLQQSLRNATTGSIRTFAGGDGLAAAVALPDGGWECRAWALDATTHTLMYKTHGHTAFAADPDTTGWAKLGTAITVPSSATLFAVSDGNGEVAYRFDAGEDGTGVPVAGSVAPQAVVEGGAGPC